MILYKITDSYIKELEKVEKKVLSSHSDDRKYARPHIGVLIKTTNFNFFIPLSSPDSKDFINKSVRKSTVTIKRLFDDKNQFLGKLLINNMIPVPISEVSKINLAYKDSLKEEDKNYLSLLNKQRTSILKRQEEIKRDANLIYQQKTNQNTKEYWKGKQPPNYLSATVDFKRAEQICSEWIKMTSKKTLPLNGKEVILKNKAIRYGEEKPESLIYSSFVLNGEEYKILDIYLVSGQTKDIALLQRTSDNKLFIDNDFASQSPLKLNLKEQEAISDFKTKLLNKTKESV